MENEIIYLDLNNVGLYGWEERKSDLVVDSIVRGIDAGDNFPPVLVYRIDDKTYELTDLSEDPNFPKRVGGGHYRAVGHYIANKPLKCIVVGKVERRTKPIKIEDIILEDDDKIVGNNISLYDSKKRADQKYR